MSTTQRRDIGEMVELYEAGTSLEDLRRMYHVNFNALKDLLVGQGVTLRTPGEAQRTRWWGATREDRAAHGRATGVHKWAGKLTDQRVAERRARARMRNVDGVMGIGEDEVAAALRKRGLAVWPQYPCGRYSIDMVLAGVVALEVHRQVRYPLTLPQHSRRQEVLAAAGYPVIYLWCSTKVAGKFCAAEVAYDLIAKTAQENSLPGGEYLVVRCDGSLPARRG
jgi:hypothetical protein